MATAVVPHRHGILGLTPGILSLAGYQAMNPPLRGYGGYVVNAIPERLVTSRSKTVLVGALVFLAIAFVVFAPSRAHAAESSLTPCSGKSLPGKGSHEEFWCVALGEYQAAYATGTHSICLEAAWSHRRKCTKGPDQGVVVRSNWVTGEEPFKIENNASSPTTVHGTGFNNLTFSGSEWEAWELGLEGSGGGGNMAFQANTGQLFVDFPHHGGPGNTELAMAPGTSPSIATLDNGNTAIAFQTNGNQLWSRLGSGPYENTGFGMAAGTSPSIAALPAATKPGKYVMAFQSNGGTLWTRKSTGAYENTLLGMAAGTSPSVVALSTEGQYVMAFQSNGGTLWSRKSSGAYENTGFGMASGTSPSVATISNGEYVMAFQSNGNTLWTRRSNGAFENTGFGMAAGTSPSIAALGSNQYVMAFQSNGGELWERESSGAFLDLGLTMRAGTSPSVTPLPWGGYEIAIQAANGELVSVDSENGVTTLTAQGMAAGTSPSISPPN